MCRGWAEATCHETDDSGSGSGSGEGEGRTVREEWPTEYCRHSPRGWVGQRVMVTIPSLHMMSPVTMQIHAKCEAADGKTAPEQRSSGMPPEMNRRGCGGHFVFARCCRHHVARTFAKHGGGGGGGIKIIFRLTHRSIAQFCVTTAKDHVKFKKPPSSPQPGRVRLITSSPQKAAAGHAQHAQSFVKQELL